MVSSDDVGDQMGREGIVFAQQAVLTTRTRALRDEFLETLISKLSCVFHSIKLDTRDDFGRSRVQSA
jgi:hypothetical protein